MLKWTLALALLAGGAEARPPYKPMFDPSALKVGPKESMNEVLVLGTTHLANLPKDFDPVLLEPLVDRLVALRPQIITIESLSGPQCDYLRLHEGRYRPAGSIGYCRDLGSARAAVGLDVPAAMVEIDRLLKAWPKNPTAAQRRHLAALFLAGGDRTSAFVQWLRLPPAERRAGDGLDAELVGLLESLKSSLNENFLIAAPVAARLGLERVYPVDDHTADFVYGDPAEGSKAIKALWKNNASAQRRANSDPYFARVSEKGGVLALYRVLNSESEGRLAFEADFGATSRDPEPPYYGRAYAGRWETRNLRMVANIREVLAMHPGARALSIVGAAHKGYFEAYLHMMHGVRLIDAQSVLR